MDEPQTSATHQVAQPPYRTPPPTSAMAVMSFIMGILALPPSLCAGPLALFTLPFSLTAIICGHVSKSNIRRYPDLQGEWMALTGCVLGYISAIVTALVFVWIITSMLLTH